MASRARIWPAMSASSRRSRFFFGQGLVVGQEAVEEGGLEGRLQEPLLAVLGGVEEKLRAKRGQSLAGSQPVADVDAAAAGAGGQLPAQDQVLAVQHEKGLDHGLFAARPHEVRVHLLAGQEVDRRNDEALAGPGLAGQDIEALAELQFQVVDEGQIFDAQHFDHSAVPTAAAWGPGCRAGFPR